MKAILEEAFSIARSCCQLTHYHDQIFLDRQDLVRNKFINRNGPGHAKRGAQFINASICVYTRISF